MRIIIVGGGVIGLCTAYYLQKAGFKVGVIDRGDISDGCSFGNMGYISPSHITPLASPGIIRQGLKWMLSSSSPFYIKPRLNLDLLRWGFVFWRKANARQAEEGSKNLNNLLQLSRELMNDFKSEFHDSFDMIEKGCFMLYKTEKTGEHEKHLAEDVHRFGLKTEICTAERVQQYEPEVEVNVAGGVLYLDDCHINTRKFMEVLYVHLKNTGTQFFLNSEVRNFEVLNGAVSGIITDKFKLNADQIIIANGSWMPAAAKMLGIHLLMQPGKGYSIVYDKLEKNLHYPSILVDDRTATTPIHRWLRIGGTMELSGHNNKIFSKRVLAIYQAFKKYYPSMNIQPPDPGKAWYGYRPVTPDGLPYIGRHKKYRNLVFAGGHAMLGVSAAAATGKLVEEIITDKQPDIPLEAFNPSRFES